METGRGVLHRFWVQWPGMGVWFYSFGWGHTKYSFYRFFSGLGDVAFIVFCVVHSLRIRGLGLLTLLR